MSNFCVCCGAEIPEGRMICPTCEATTQNNTDNEKEKKE